jgi:hypothetical protein
MRAAASGDPEDKELGEGSAFEDNRLPGTGRKGCHYPGKNLKGIGSLFTRRPASSKKSNKLRGRPLCMRWSRIFNGRCLLHR